ncbi:hypothetical protein LCGC14_1123710 [marine sediment metagenome]|uniref:Uncharacterized protein n=1 Tax=marine sediment metagenome TaxID=412755 RepID=A0A0F9M398_9ZZZZ
MKQSELTFCANRAQVLTTKIRHAKSVTNAQQPAVVEEAIEVAQEIVDRLQAQLDQRDIR